MTSSNVENSETRLQAEDPLIAPGNKNPEVFNFLSIPPLIERTFSLHKYLATKTRVRLYKASVWILEVLKSP